MVDGKVAFTGGVVNLADEYINEKARFGHWKDTGVRLLGEGALIWTIMFLEMWNAFQKPDFDYEAFRPHRWHPETLRQMVGGFLMRTRLDNEELGRKCVYIKFLSQAKRLCIYCNTVSAYQR